MSRSMKMLAMLSAPSTNEQELSARLLNLPHYESTKCLSSYERNLAVDRWKGLEVSPRRIAHVTPTVRETPVQFANVDTARRRLNFASNITNIGTHTTNISASLTHIATTTPIASNVKVNFSESPESPREPYNSSGSEYLPIEADTVTSNSDEELQTDTNISPYLHKQVIPSISKKVSVHKFSVKSMSNRTSKIEIKHDKFKNGEKEQKLMEVNYVNLKRKITNTNDNIDNNLDFYETLIESSEENKKVVIKPAAKTSNGKRVRDKGHSCYFCHKQIIHLARHFEVVHSNEISVARVLAKPKRSDDRRKSFGHLIRAGDFYHNCEVLAMKKKELILVRRPTKAERKFVNYFDYGPCPECLGFMLKKHLWRHIKYNCTKKLDADSPDGKRQTIAESTSILNGIFGVDFSAEFISNIINKLRSDDIGQICREDKLIMNFGALQFEKYSCTQNELIRQYMRQLARLLLELKKVDYEIKCLSDCLVPNKFDIIVQATKSLCSNHVEVARRPEFEVPSLALKIGYALKKCVAIERGQALRQENLKRNENLVSFLNLMDLEWNIRISANALSTLYKRKMNTTQLLPLTTDLVKLSKYLDNDMKIIMDQIKSSTTAQTWSRLVAVTLSRIILFNKRRSGESARMTIAEYNSRPAWSEQGTQELKNSLSIYEKQLASRLTMVEVKGKRGNKVPVLTRDMKMAIDLILKTRNEACVAFENPYVFARLNNSLSSVRGHECLRKLCQEADLESPDFITGTKLRKYVATVCQIFNLSENETDWLAKHLGHDIRVHREYYRLHESAVELTKVSRLLLAVDKGKANQYSGMKLDDIDIEDLPPVEQDNEVDDSENETNSQPNEICRDELKGSRKLSGDALKKPRRPKAKVHKKNWSTQECEAVLKYFKTSIKCNTLPRKEQCIKCIEKFPQELASRKWTDIKFYVKNHLTRINKRK